MTLQVIPVSLRAANEYVARHHRHHAPARGCKFCIGVIGGNSDLVGVAIIGRPVARGLDTGRTAEVVRCCTDGTRNACSMLYGAAWRAARAMGYQRLVTYTLPAEGGASLRGAGWILIGERGGGNWNTPSRPRTDTAQPLRGPKFLWERAV